MKRNPVVLPLGLWHASLPEARACGALGVARVAVLVRCGLRRRCDRHPRAVVVGKEIRRMALDLDAVIFDEITVSRALFADLTEVQPVRPGFARTHLDLCRLLDACPGHVATSWLSRPAHPACARNAAFLSLQTPCHDETLDPARLSGALVPPV